MGKLINCSEDERGRVVVDVEISKVLKGELKPIRKESFRFAEYDSETDLGELKKQMNSMFIMAFNGGFHRYCEKDPLDVQNAVFLDFSREIAPSQIVEWQRKLAKTHFHFTSAWLVSFVAEPRREKIADRVQVRIDEMFVENQINECLVLGDFDLFPSFPKRQFHVGDVVNCFIPNHGFDYCPDEHFEVAGSRAIWLFDMSFSKDGITINNLISPFPRQQFSEADIAVLKTDIDVSHRRLPQLVQNLKQSVSAFWTAKRIIDYCRPENLYVPYHAALKPGMSGEPFVCGKLAFPNQDVGKVTWYADMRDGEPNYYQLDVEKNGLHWRVGSHCADLLRKVNRWLEHVFSGKRMAE